MNSIECEFRSHETKFPKMKSAEAELRIRTRVLENRVKAEANLKAERLKLIASR